MKFNVKLILPVSQTNLLWLNLENAILSSRFAALTIDFHTYWDYTV